ncbi:MAG: PolC-type DNA polymerase III [Firmicutes bacterium]|nr:PolC-type DNA polymerase III [Bacillota bacterium]
MIQKTEQPAARLSEVLSHIPLSPAALSALGQARVNHVRVDGKTGAMSLGLSLGRIVDEAYLRELRSAVAQAMPFLSAVELDIRYAGGDSDCFMADYWRHCLKDIRRTHPVCFKALEAADPRLDGGSFTARVKRDNLAFLKKAGVEDYIQRLFDSQLEGGPRFALAGAEGSIGSEDPGAAAYPRAGAAAEVMAGPAAEDPPAAAGKADKKEKAPSKPQNDKTGSAHNKTGKRGGLKLNPALNGQARSLSQALEESEKDDIVYIEGEIFALDSRETRGGGLLVTFDVKDRGGAVSVKAFTAKDEPEGRLGGALRLGQNVLIKGRVQYDEYAGELNVMAAEIRPAARGSERADIAPRKRVELHLHTNMSSMDGVSSATDLINAAKSWGHTAIAITDHGVAQAFPEAMNAAKKDIKVIYGMEAYIVDDLGAVAQMAGNLPLDTGYTVFDLETTGLSRENDKIIEIGAVRIRGGVITDTFSRYVDPGVSLPAEITALTGITDAMLAGAPDIARALPEFLAFAGADVLVAHNAGFDMGFVLAAAKRLESAAEYDIENPVLDTVELSRALFPELTRHKLNTVAEHLGVSLENHHRASDDARAAAEILLKCLKILDGRGINTLSEINLLSSQNVNKIRQSYHAVILAKNRAGLRNLYELISRSHLEFYSKRPRIPKSAFLRLREGLIIGTACEAGEFYRAILGNKPDRYIRELAEFYDYFEIQPVGNNRFMLREGTVRSADELMDINRRITALGERFNKPVVATCDAHFLNPEDEVYRRIIMASEGFKDADNQAPLYLRTTDEMLKEFEYLGAEKSYEVVVTNTNLIADMIDDIRPIPDETYPPRIDGAAEQLERLVSERVREIYGENPPDIIKERLAKELDSIIKHGFAVMYIISQKLVSKSMEDGYLVGSRGSVGSSFVATMAGITEVNPMPPHYICPGCKFSDFTSDAVLRFAGGSGCDMPDRLCPVCGVPLNKDGHDIPFETFLGFDGDKEPDIDLNFSGEYQARAHAYAETLFGKGNVFKAGTIGTIADKTAFGFVKKYLEERNKSASRAEISRLVSGCTGIKRTTGQHPGGLMILPSDHSIYEFCPVQRPANDETSDITTTHFDYHSIHGRLLKLDLLGHDVPTIIRSLHDSTGIDPRGVDLGDRDVLSLFTSTEALGVTPEEINCKTGTLGLPEFGTGFVRGMLLETKPSTFSELVRISGLSHGTDVWFGNAQELIRSGTAALKDIIPTRDDIMVYLMNKGVEKKASFKIMENVRKGRGLTAEEEATMRAAGVPDWYIQSCKKIKYMFPKGHAVAYVMMTVRIGYFKIHHPYSFYAALFSEKVADFDYELMCRGADVASDAAARINAMGKEAGAKDRNTLTVLELVLEMYARGLKFLKLDIYRSAAKKFIVTPDGLLPPLCSIQGLGDNVAQNIVSAREDGGGIREFFTIEDFRERTKINKTVIELLRKNRILDGLPETNQLSLFQGMFA